MPKSSFFSRLGEWASTHAGFVVCLFVVVFGLAFYYVQELPIRTAYLDLLPAGDPIVEKYESVQAELRGLDVAAILLRLRNPPEDLDDRARLLFLAADRIIAELDPNIIARASYFLPTETKLPPELLVFRTLYPKERERLAEIAALLLSRIEKLAEQKPFSIPEKIPDDPAELDRVLAQVIETGRHLLSLFGEIPEIQALLSEASELIERAQSRALPEDKGQPILSLDHTQLVIQVRPTQPVYASQAFNRAVRDELRRAVRAADLGSLGIEAGLTGGYVISTEVEDVIWRDMAVVTLASSALVFLLTLLVLGSPILVVLALIPVAVSAVFTAAWAKFSVHGFNLLTTFLPALVLGLGIDFSLHLFSRFSEARRDGLGLREAIQLAVRTKGPASFVAGLTTAAVFFCLLLSRSRALWELGAVMSLGVMVSFFTVFVFGPALAVLVGKVFPNLRGRPILSRARLYPPYRHLLLLRKGVILSGLIVIAMALAEALNVEFKFASGELAPATAGQAVLQEIVRNFGGEIWLGDTFRVFVPTARELGALSEKLKENPLVHSVVSARALLPAELLGEAARLQHLPIPAAKAVLSSLAEILERWPGLGQNLEDTAAVFSVLELQALISGEVRKAQVFSRRAGDLFSLAEEVKAFDPNPLQAALAAMAESLRTLEAFAKNLQALPEEAELIDQILAVLPVEIRSQYRISRGYIIELRVRPELYQGRNLQRFLDWLEDLGVDYVGSPEIKLALEHHMRRDFFLTSGVAFLLIFLVVLVDFRRPGKALFSVVPLAMGYTCMLGGMAALGLRFNFTNIVISPLLIGYGVNGAVHFLHRYGEENRSREAVVWAAAATAGPTLGSYFTTMASFGALLAAQTPGLRYLGASALLGLGFTVLWTILFLPAVAAELRKAERGTKVL